jgi:RNA polymerase sigma-70 factor, ECF subfamily
VDEQSARLVARWRDGDQGAAAELFDRFTQRLLALARSRLSDRLARRVDAEDVVQSAYRSFFIGARNGRFVLQRSGDLWRLLAAITLHKARRQIEHHTAGKRAVGREAALAQGSVFGLQPELLDREPDPADVAAVVDELERVMRSLQPLHRRMVELRLQGNEVDEIATATERSERMVRLVLAQTRRELEQRCAEAG